MSLPERLEGTPLLRGELHQLCANSQGDVGVVYHHRSEIGRLEDGVVAERHFVEVQTRFQHSLHCERQGQGHRPVEVQVRHQLLVRGRHLDRRQLKSPSF